MLFLKIWDDREQELAFMDLDYASPLVDVKWTDPSGDVETVDDLRWGVWAANDEGTRGNELPEFVDAYQRMKSGQLLR